MTNNSIFKKTFLAILLLSLPSCKWFKQNHNSDCLGCCGVDGSETLLSIDGKALLTQKDFDNLINDITEANEQARMMLQLIPRFQRTVF